MKIKLDENLPVRLVTLLTDLGHQVDTVADEGLTGRPDADVWERVKQEDRFFITQDLDFSDIRTFEPGTHPGILLLRLREPGANALFKHVSDAFLNHDPETWSEYFIVLTEQKMRINRPH